MAAEPSDGAMDVDVPSNMLVLKLGDMVTIKGKPKFYKDQMDKSNSAGNNGSKASKCSIIGC